MNLLTIKFLFAVLFTAQLLSHPLLFLESLDSYPRALHKRDNEQGGNATDPTTGTDQEKPACVKGTKLGSFIITSPNRSSIVVVGADYVVFWKYTPLVKAPPKKIDVKIQQVEPRTTESWTNVVAENLTLDSPQVQSFVWTVPPLNDGQYKIRIVPDGKETFGVTADKLPCFGDGEVVPATSGAFKVVNPVSLLPYPDKFGPLPSHSDHIQMSRWSIPLVFLIIIFL